MTIPAHEETDVDAHTGEQATLPPDDRHSLLAAARRRLTLDVLAETTGVVELEALAAEVAARDVGRDPVDGSAVKHVAIDLHHVHLPKLADYGLVTYDPSTHWIDPERRMIDAIREPAGDG